MKLNFRFTLLLAFAMAGYISKAQNSSVAIGTGTPDPSAVLLLVGSGSQGLILPKADLSISSAFGKAGMVVYNTKDDKIYYYDVPSSSWKTLGGAAAASQTISISGNTITVGSGASSSIKIAGNTATPTAGQFLMWNTTSNQWEATSVSGDVSNASGVLNVTGIQGKQVVLPSSGVQYLSYDASQAKWIFQTPSGSGDMTKIVYDTNSDNIVDKAAALTTTLPVNGGGTGLTAAPANGQLLIGNGTGYALANLTAGTGINITNSAGGISVASTGLSNPMNAPNQMIIGGAAGAPAMLAAPTANQILTSSNTNVPTWLSAISGNQVTPNFGSQAISTSGTFASGPATITGTLSSGATTVTGLTVTAPATKLNGVTYFWPSSLTAGNFLQTDVGGNLTWAPVSVTETDPVVKGINGLVKGTGTSIIAATAGTDYLAPFSSQTAKFVYAAPNAAAGAPSFRALVASDIPTLNQNTTGSAGSVINALSVDNSSLQLSSGTTYNGSTALTVSVKASGITNAMLAGTIASSKLVGNDIATVGTITTGKWNGTVISEAFGGTNQTSYAAGDILYASSPTTLSKLAIATPGQVLTVNTGGTAPFWATPATGWALTGNAGTVDGTNFIGTTDNIPLNFKVNGQKAGRIDAGASSTFYGYQAGNVTSGVFNTAIGNQALLSNSAGTWNTAIGSNAQVNTSTGVENTAVGGGALGTNTTGSYNTAVGLNAMYFKTAGDNNTAIGYYADIASGSSNATAIGNHAYAGVSNSLVLGSINGVNGATVSTNVGIGTSTPISKLDVSGDLHLSPLGAAPAPVTDKLYNVGGNLFWNGTDISSGGGGGWGLTGNTGTTPGTNFIGTSDSQDLVFKTNSTERIRVTQSGNVGIGTNSPSSVFHATWNLNSNINPVAIIETTGTGSSAAMSFRNAAGQSYAMGILGSGDFSISSQGYNVSVNDAIRISSAGNVGIGVANPSSKLDVQANLASPANAINATNNGTGNALYAYAVNGGTGAWGYSPTGTGVEGQSGTSNGVLGYSDSGIGVYGSTNTGIAGYFNGKVGIGTTSPSAPLHVSTHTGSTGSLAYTGFAQGSAALGSGTGNNANVAIRADGFIWSNGYGFLATSDKRIKDVIGKTDNAKDLIDLKQIEITDYKFIDKTTNGNATHKKVIAQQVKSVYPNAVITQQGVIPNVFEVAKRIKINGTQTIIETSKSHQFAEGDEVQLVLEKTGEKHVKVFVVSEREFGVNEVINESIFVYGKKVNDLLSVDYDALTTLNISATQQLSKEVDSLKSALNDREKKIAELETALKAIKSEKVSIEQLSAEIEKIKKALYMEASAKKK